MRADDLKLIEWFKMMMKKDKKAVLPRRHHNCGAAAKIRKKARLRSGTCSDFGNFNFSDFIALANLIHDINIFDYLAKNRVLTV